MLHKILKIVAAVISLVGIISLIRIISEGDDAIDAAALSGDTSLVEPMAWAAYIMLGLVLAFVIIFVVKNLLTDTAGLKNTLIGVGAFAAVLVIAYVLSGGDTMQYRLQDGFATEGQSTMVGAGLVAFYLLLAIAAISMTMSGVKKIISK
jgi:hypothetical protein